MVTSKYLHFAPAALAMMGLNAALGSLGISSALAGDMPAPVYKTAAPATYNWSGCYIGVHAGGGLLVTTFIETANDPGGAGAVAGGQAGCNYQAAQFVFGIEGEGAWSSITNRSFSADLFSSSLVAVRNRWDADLALRVGYALDRALIYGKAGAALGRFEFSSEDALGNFERGQSTLPGLLLGIGLEYGFAPNWTAKVEYNAIDFANHDVRFQSDDVSFTQTQSAWKQVVKAGVNFRFGN
jgi:outer membrane immunogenic protein